MCIVGLLIILLGGGSCTAVRPNAQALDLSEAFLPHSLLDECWESSRFALPILEEWAHSAGTSANDRASIALFEGYVDQAEQVITAMLDNYSQLETLFYPDRDYYLDVLNRLGLRGPALAWWRQIRGGYQQDEIYRLCARLKAIRDFTSAMEREWRGPMIRGSPEKLAVLGAIYKCRLRLQQLYLMIRAFPGDEDVVLNLEDEEDLAQFQAPRRELCLEYLELIELLFARLGELGPLCEEGDPRDFRVFGEFFSDAVLDRINDDVEGSSYDWDEFRLPVQYRVTSNRDSLDDADRMPISKVDLFSQAVVANFSCLLAGFRSAGENFYWKLWSGPPCRRSLILWMKIMSLQMVLRDQERSLCSTVEDLQRSLSSIDRGIVSLARPRILKALSRTLSDSQALQNLGRISDLICHRMHREQIDGYLLRDILELGWLARLLGGHMSRLSQMIFELLDPTKALSCAAALYPSLFRAASQLHHFLFTVEKLMMTLREAGVEFAAERLQRAHGLDPPESRISQEQGRIFWPEIAPLVYRIFSIE